MHIGIYTDDCTQFACTAISSNNNGAVINLASNVRARISMHSSYGIEYHCVEVRATPTSGVAGDWLWSAIEAWNIASGQHLVSRTCVVAFRI